MSIDELMDWMQAQGLGTKGTDIFAYAPPGTDTCVYVTPISGFKSERAMGNKTIPIEKPRFQITARHATNLETALTKADSIYDALDGLSSTTMGSTVWYDVQADGPPAYLGPDDNNRHRCVINITAQKAKSA